MYIQSSTGPVLEHFSMLIWEGGLGCLQSKSVVLFALFWENSNDGVWQVGNSSQG